jgi:hypothetical protein
MTQYYRPDVIQVQTQRRSMRGMRGLGEAPVVVADASGTTLTYPADVTWMQGGMSLSYALHPVAWAFGLFATGWAGGYLTWLFLGRKKRKY